MMGPLFVSFVRWNANTAALTSMNKESRLTTMHTMTRILAALSVYAFVVAWFFHDGGTLAVAIFLALGTCLVRYSERFATLD